MDLQTVFLPVALQFELPGAQLARKLGLDSALVLLVGPEGDLVHVPFGARWTHVPF